MPDFQSRDFIINHVRWMADFYSTRCLDPRGGFFQFYELDGSIGTRDTRGLVASARMTVSFCMAARTLGRNDVADLAAHGLQFLLKQHRSPEHGGYSWTLRWDGSTFAGIDNRNCAYGLVHVMLALAHAHRVGIPGAKDELEALFWRMEKSMRDDIAPLYREEFSAEWSPLSEYRGQNANMHGCEALIAAHIATGDAVYLKRASEIADFLCFRSARATKDFVYEHFDPEWNPDYDYNKGDFSDLYRPWGFQPGHQTEWAKLLMQLFAITKDARFAVRAQEMFDKAVMLATDRDFGGLVYGLDPDLQICNPDKYFWVQIESAAAVFKLAQWSGERKYFEQYDELWRICWSHFVDHTAGSWFRQLTNDFRPLAPNKGTGGKDYHVIGACHDILGFDAK